MDKVAAKPKPAAKAVPATHTIDRELCSTPGCTKFTHPATPPQPRWKKRYPRVTLADVYSDSD